MQVTTPPSSARTCVDLHTHTYYSDGSLSPGALIDQAETKRLAAIALTDHDTTAGLGEARIQAARYPDLLFIPGIEISARFPGGTLHFLGLNIDESAPALRTLTARLRDARSQRNPRMVARLQELGFGIDMDDLRTAAGPSVANGTLGRLHMAIALQRKGCVKTIQEAFAKYLGAQCPAYVDKERTLPREAIGTIRESGGMAVLAHPSQLGCANVAQLERVVREYIEAGLGGIECYHSDHTPQQTRGYLDLARRYDLLVTGGSDFHGLGKPHVELGRPRVPLRQVNLDLLR